MRHNKLRGTDSYDRFFMTDYPFYCRFGGGDRGMSAAQLERQRQDLQDARMEDRRFMAQMQQQELQSMQAMEDSRREHERYLREMTKREELAIQRALREQTEFVAEEAAQVAEGEYIESDEGLDTLDFYELYEEGLN